MRAAQGRLVVCSFSGSRRLAPDTAAHAPRARPLGTRGRRLSADGRVSIPPRFAED